VLTTIAAFAPMLYIPGPMGKFMMQIPICVMTALSFSLIESTLILPSHLAHIASAGRKTHRLGAVWETVQGKFSQWLERFVERIYRPALELALSWRYLTVSIGVAILITTLGLTAGGWVHFTFFPSVEADNVVAFVTMPQGTPARVTAKAVSALEASAKQVLDEIEIEEGNGVLRHLMASVGEQPFKTKQSRRDFASIASPHLGEVNLALVPSEDRSLTSREVLRRWRAATPPIPGAVEVSFSSALIRSGEPINIQLQGNDLEQLTAAAERVKEHLAGYPGVADIADSFREGKREVELQILPSAEALGITMAQLGRQVRQAFYGEEVQRIQRGRDDVRVMVRYPAEHRRSLADIEQMRVRTPDGGEVPFRAVAAMTIGHGYASIDRVDRQRVVNVTADVDYDVANANEIIETMQKSFLPGLRNEFRGVRYSLEGEQRDQAEFLGAMARGFILAILAIYALLAVPLGSYGQPLIIMSAIPFGLIGATWGHAILGWDLSMFSLIGFVALTGVVVNDSLVLVSYVNENRDAGVPLVRAVRQAGVARFRPILLTSLTTFAGLTPLMMEKSVQAQFLIPMAISLAWGVLFATAISLVIVPALYIIMEDFRSSPEPQESPAATETVAAG
jgi:multidrug efflux pump subunit AcrB